MLLFADYVANKNRFRTSPVLVIMAARQPPAILFYRCSLDLFFLFSPPNLRGRLADRHQTLPHVRW